MGVLPSQAGQRLTSVEGEQADAFVQSRRLGGSYGGLGGPSVGLPHLAGLDGAPGSYRQVGRE